MLPERVTIDEASSVYESLKKKLEKFDSDVCLDFGKTVTADLTLVQICCSVVKYLKGKGASVSVKNISGELETVMQQTCAFGFKKSIESEIGKQEIVDG
jgi:anti-anti-sigma regulatory factor